MDKQRVISLAYHRNGICGEGFYAGIVEETEGKSKRNMLVVRFDKETVDGPVGMVCCAAFDCALVAKHDIEFGSNSWRGDHYADVMDEAIAAYRANNYQFAGK